MASANRVGRQNMAKETVKILENCSYTPEGSSEAVDIIKEVEFCVENTKVYTPEELETLIKRSFPKVGKTKIEVAEETSLSACRRLVQEFDSNSVACLNFASAKHAGGGFLSGAQAQEESLARSSALYPSLKTATLYYSTNAHYKPAGLYKDHLIYSPCVPVFRDDGGSLLPQYPVNFVTMPAVNAGVLRTRQSDCQSLIEDTMRRRCASVLAVAAERGNRAVVLGAWGCGVFKNQPQEIAKWFGDCLEGQLDGVFERVVFAIIDGSKNKDNLRCFEQRFGNL